MLLNLWSVAKTRKSVVNKIKPLIDASLARNGPVSGRTWQDPYMIGFLSMLISLTARSVSTRDISGDSLGLIQLDVWAGLSEAADPSIGDRILTLSANNNPAFVEGCGHAAEFHREWLTAPGHVQGARFQQFLNDGISEPGAVIPDLVEEWPRSDMASVGGAAAAIWIRHFDSHLAPLE